MNDEKETKSTETLDIKGFQLDLSKSELRDAHGNIVPLRRQSSDVLVYLAARKGETIGKEELLDTIWPNSAVTDDSVVQCIADIRRVLGQNTVKTFPKKGYQLIVSSGMADSSDKPDSTLPNSPNRGQWLILLFVAALLGTVLTFHRFKTSPRTLEFPTLNQQNTLAVLPFVYLGEDDGLKFFSHGLSEDLTTDLSNVNGLTVISYSSSQNYQNVEQGFQKIASELGVRYLVRGTVRPDKGQIRINVSLVDSQNAVNLWADRYDRFKQNPFDVQEEVTHQIVKALSLDSTSIQARSVESDAYYMLWQGLEPLRENTIIGNFRARNYFQRALALNPGYARAHASVAVTYARDLSLQGASSKQDAIKKGLESAVQAIQIDPNIPHAYYALGLLNLGLREYDNALAAARHALKLNSNYADGYALFAEASLLGGDLNEALIAIKRAKLLHPNHPADYHWLEGHILFQLGQHEQAAIFLEKGASLNPRFQQGLLIQLANFSQLGEIDQARRLKNLLLTDESIPDVVSLGAQIPYRSGARSKKLSDELRKTPSM